MAKETMEFFDTELIPWTPIEGTDPVVYQKILSRDPEDGSYTRLVRVQSGSETAGVRWHDCWEEVFLVEGVMIDLTLNKVYSPGHFACHAPGVKHGPYRTDTGYVTLETYTYKK